MHSEVDRSRIKACNTVKEDINEEEEYKEESSKQHERRRIPQTSIDEKIVVQDEIFPDDHLNPIEEEENINNEED